MNNEIIIKRALNKFNPEFRDNRSLNPILIYLHEKKGLNIASGVNQLNSVWHICLNQFFNEQF